MARISWAVLSFGIILWPTGSTSAQDGKDEEVHKSAGAFGTEYPWAKGDLSVDGETLKEVGLRFKGNFTYVSSAQMLRRPMKIDLDRHNSDQRVDGQKNLNLSNGVTDPSRSREAMTAARKESAKGAFTGVVSQTMTPRQFIERRTTSVLAQLDGKRKGYVPGGGFGFGPPGGGFQPKGGLPRGGPGGFGPARPMKKE